MTHSPLLFSSLLFLSKKLSTFQPYLSSSQPPFSHYQSIISTLSLSLSLSLVFYQMDSADNCSKGLFLALGLVGEKETTSKIANQGPGLKSSLSFIGSNGGSEPSLRLGLSGDGFCSQASPLSPVSPFCSGRAKRDREFSSEDAEAEKVSSRVSDEDEDGSNYRKKLRLTKEQSTLLEDSFKQHSTLNLKQKQALARELNLRPRQVEVWFQNRRARTKVKQTEVDCELLKKCCENLAEENRRLQKEVEELKAVKRAHPFYVQIPATAATLSLCPSCERVGRDGHGRSAASSSELPFSVASSSSNPHFFNPFTNSSAAC